ncbi:MAG: hypothetical protein Q7J73_05400 [Dehalococcoidales bacterium]|nr:hypothetical protein [Dehalococcoidales bacterium]
MSEYQLTVLDYRLPDGQPFTVTVCGYNGKVRHMSIGTDAMRHLRGTSVDVTESKCQASKHCLALSCPLNKTEPMHLAHLLEMPADESLDEETASICGTKSSVDALVKFADKMSEIIPEELRNRKEPEQYSAGKKRSGARK